MEWGTLVEHEVKRRIQLSVAAYAYEHDQPLTMTDAEFDKTALEIHPTMDTGRPKLDEFFRTEFSPYTGMWIHKHPELSGIRRLYETYYRDKLLVTSRIQNLGAE